MKSEAEKILFLEKSEEEYNIKFLPNYRDKKIDESSMKFMLKNEIKDYYETYVSYCKNNSADYLKIYNKNVSLSKSLRKEGNDILFKKKHNAEIHEEIWKLYTKAIAAAPIESEELCQAYGNRSYILLHFNKFEESIHDIDRVVALSKSEPLIIKLLCRKIICLTALGDIEQRMNVWKTIQSLYDSMDEDLKNESLDKLIKQAEQDMAVTKFDQILESKKICLPLSSDVKFKFNEYSGVHLVTNSDKEPGEIIMVAKPFVTGANSNKNYAYCSHCLAFTWASIPCDFCSLSMFCSEQCKTEAWEKYHKVECKILPYIQFNFALYYYYQISIRAIVIGVVEAGGIEELKRKLKEFDNSLGDCKKNFLNEDIFTNKFIDFYQMSYEFNLRFFTQYLKNIPLLLSTIIHATDFLGEDLKSKSGAELVEDENENPKEQECKKNRSHLDCVGFRCCSRGSFILPLITKIGYDCNAHCSKLFTDDGKIVVYCTQPMKKNDQICINKFNYFYRENKEARQDLMKISQNKVCKCNACENNWPTMNELYRRYAGDMIEKNSPQAILAPELIPRYKNISQYKKDDYMPDDKTFQQISRDVSMAVNKCSQPTFLSCVLIDVLSMVVDNRYGTKLQPLPDTCSKY